jgi:DNA-binding beta-propeller fold protein YncE
VADTWHHRIQKFTADGHFIIAWGEGGIGNEPYGLFGPRDVTVHPRGFVFISDTGNHRLVVYDQQGNYLSQIGGTGSQPGRFNEPVGLALDPDGNLYVADQGNRRVQVFSVSGNGNLASQATWPVDAWSTNAQGFKPYLCFSNNNVFITDPETGTVQEYTSMGKHLNDYEINNTGYLNYGILYGIACDPEGGLWVSDFIGGTGVLVKVIP